MRRHATHAAFGMAFGTVILLASRRSGAEEIRWAMDGRELASGNPMPAITGAPDGVSASPARVLASRFALLRSYPNLASFLGISPAMMARANVIAWELNGGSPGGSGGWESARWIFTSRADSIVVDYNEVTGLASNAAFLGTGSVRGAQFGPMFGVPSAPAGNVYSWILFDLPPHFDLRALHVEIDAGAVVGIPGEGTPDPDAVGVMGCLADLDDGSGRGTPDDGVTIDDLLYYLGLFAAGDARADLDDGSGAAMPDGGVTIDDLLYFLGRYSAGC